MWQLRNSRSGSGQDARSRRALRPAKAWSAGSRTPAEDYSIPLRVRLQGKIGCSESTTFSDRILYGRNGCEQRFCSMSRNDGCLDVTVAIEHVPKHVM